ncbi:hypothetical protein DRE43_28290 [Salmonella enterica subsp. enterica serovar Java]|uniref:Uncharacterized protein n=1 Tax=Salmonella enterica TaxID=28901 RepID=A0A403N339_SALER|nr:hypothetical protein [Salmonella enterica subsp. diarizonae]EAU1515990.1 hypothetical protein [Salmonella enterica]EBQ9442689.1 hypothetical protein [Salmonella enterica subsp. enterica serovar Cerro]EBX2068454.1 hypothetical protein [Salmonella enterica subsp. enterica serovar Java]EDO1589008.1 hypothetical protein [Salmonella enterica subsp. enterica serovar Adelaide]EDW6120677.1 hypothetical protein [Salmonella enterica subsp. salamae]EHE8612588.1 hypothetical protein [Salmonella enteri
MENIIEELQYLPQIYTEYVRLIFTAISLFTLGLNLLLRIRNHRNHPPGALYHYTTYSRLMLIIKSEHIRGGNHGIVFTTANKKYRNKGTARYRNHNQTDKSDECARIVFRNQALTLFRSKTNSFISLFTGTAMYAERGDEFITRKKGNIKLVQYRFRGKTLVVRVATIIDAPFIEKIYTKINGSLLSIPKTIFTGIHLMTLLFWVDYFHHLMWFRSFWFIGMLFYIAAIIISVLFANCLYFFVRHRLGLP